MDEQGFALCEQLHRQYAEADNNKTKNLLAFITAISIIFTGYGIVVYNYAKSKNDEEAYLLLVATLLVSFILAMISVISMNYGYTQRRDHLIIQSIRKIVIKKEDYAKIFGDASDDCGDNTNGSKPYNAAGKTLLSFMPDYYLIISISCILLQLGVSIFSSYLLGLNDTKSIDILSTACRCSLFVLTLLVIIAMIKCFAGFSLITILAYASCVMFLPLQCGYIIYILLLTFALLVGQICIFYYYYEKYKLFYK